MVVGFDIRPLFSPHRVRGIGWYTKRLLVALKKLAKKKKDFGVVELKSQEDFKRKKYDLLHLPYFHPYFLTLPLFKKTPLVVTIHDLIPVKYPQHFPPGLKGRLRWWLQKQLMKRVDFIITDSFASKYDIAEYASYPQDRIFVVYLAADPAFRMYKAKNNQIPNTNDEITTNDQLTNKCFKLQVPNSEFQVLSSKFQKKYRLPQRFVLYVGDVNWNKNVPGLVRACQKLGVPLVIVGKQAASDDFDPGHPENKDLVWLQKMREKYPPRAPYSGFYILTLGYVPTADLVTIYNLATVYCQPSFDEGFGLPVLEAMACGCPVVASNRGSLPEVVGDAGILVEPTVEGLSNGIFRVWQNKKLRQSLAQKGVKWAACFSWEQTAKRTFAVYQLIF